MYPEAWRVPMSWRRTFSAVVIVLGLGVASGLAQESDFYREQLRAGKEAFIARRDLEAIDHLRIAAFGLLGRPPELSEALARLALAQSAAKRTEDVRATLERFLDVERRFPSFESARLEPQTHGTFRRLLNASIPRETLAGIPSLSGVGTVSAGTAARNPAGPPPRASSPPARSVPVEDSVPRPSDADARRATPAARAPESPLAAPTPTPPPRNAAVANSPASTPDDAVFEPPRYRSTVKPVYPAGPLRNRIGGIVLLRVLVSETGRPMEIDVVREVHPDLSAAAIGAVRHWNFEPARRNGVAIAAWTTVPIPFRP